MKIGMALTRRRQPRKAVGTQILCKRTRAGTHLLAYIPSRTSIARRVIARARPHMYMCMPSVYTLAVIGYRLYRVQQPYGAQPDSWECGLRYRNRAPSNPIPLHLVLRFATAFFRFPPSFLVLSLAVDALFVQSTLFLSSLHQRDPETCGFDVVMQIIRYGYSVSQPSLINHLLLSFISS